MQAIFLFLVSLHFASARPSIRSQSPSQTKSLIIVTIIITMALFSFACMCKTRPFELDRTAVITTKPSPETNVSKNSWADSHRFIDRLIPHLFLKERSQMQPPVCVLCGEPLTIYHLVGCVVDVYLIDHSKFCFFSPSHFNGRLPKSNTGSWNSIAVFYSTTKKFRRLDIIISWGSTPRQTDSYIPSRLWCAF